MLHALSDSGSIAASTLSYNLSHMEAFLLCFSVRCCFISSFSSSTYYSIFCMANTKMFQHFRLWMLRVEDKVQGSSWGSRGIALSPSRLPKTDHSQRYQSLQHITQWKLWSWGTFNGFHVRFFLPYKSKKIICSAINFSDFRLWTGKVASK